MNHICVMGEGHVANLVAHNASLNEGIIVSRFSVEAHKVIELMPKYFVSCWVPKADLYVIVQDKWPSVFYYEDVVERYGNDQKVLYIGDNMEVCAEHTRRWGKPVAFGLFDYSAHATSIRLDVGLPSGREGQDYLELIGQAFGNIERLRYTSLAALYTVHTFYKSAFNVWPQNSS